jgi:hypothetical protein
MTYNRPGVYVNERLLPAPIAATGTANAAGAIVAEFAQGPETVTLVTSWYDFVKFYGGYNVLYPATFGVGQFFQNGGAELYVRRIIAADADLATVTVPKSTTGNIGTVTAKNKGSEGTNLRVQFTATASSTNWNLTVYKEGSSANSSTLTNDIVLEQYRNLSFDALSPDFADSVVNQSSSYITIAVTSSGIPSTAILPLAGSDLDGTTIETEDYIDGLADFEILNRPLVVFSPEVWSKRGDDADLIQNALVEWASLNNSFAVLDTAPGLTVNAAITYASSVSPLVSHAAVYYPYIYIQDPVGRSSSALRKIGPAGGVAGLYISTDKQVGPFKAPAGLRANIRGALALEKAFTTTELDNLNAGVYTNDGDDFVGAAVNAIRNVPGAGIVAMGARTLLQDGTANKYVNMRRSLNYINKSLSDIAETALFENNDERLWARLRTAMGAFLNDYRNQGGLRGATAADAYFVKIDAENNTNNSIALGEVHIEVGVALEYPAEFVVINLSQKTAA